MLYYAIMHALIHIGSDVFALRLFSTVCFLASLPVGYGIARRLFGSMAAIVVVALLASNAFLIVHAREVRPYTLAFLFALLATWFAVVLVERPRLSTAAAFVACAAVAVLAHAISALYLAGLFVSLGVLPGSKRGRIACALAFGALAVVLVPFLALLHGVGSSQVDWIARPRIADVGHVIFALAGGRIGEIAGVLSVVVLIVMSRTARVRVVPVIWFATPLVLIVVFSYAVHPALISRYLIALVFPLALATAVAIAALPQRFAALATIVIVVASLAGDWKARNIDPENYRAAAAYVAVHVRPASVVMGSSSMLAFDAAVIEQRLPLRAAQVLPRSDWPFWTGEPHFADIDPGRLARASDIFFVTRAHAVAGDATAHEPGRELERELERRFRLDRVTNFGYASVLHYVPRT